MCCFCEYLPFFYKVWKQYFIDIFLNHTINNEHDTSLGPERKWNKLEGNTKLQCVMEAASINSFRCCQQS